MLREAILSLVLAVSALALVSAAPAPAGCDAIAAAEASLQSDAGSGSDAPDAPTDALRVNADGYYFAYLSSIGHANADREDWYVYAVSPERNAMNANITEAFPLVPAYEVDAPAYVQTFTLTVWPPTGAPLSITSTQGTLTIVEPAPGDYLVRVSTTTLYDTDACDSTAAGAAPPLAPAAQRNHGMYLGCEPICAEGGPMTPIFVDSRLGL